MNEDNHEDHEEGYEGHEADGTSDSPPRRMRLPTPLTPNAERVLRETIGCAIAVHKELGPGFLESVYRKAMYIELDAKGLEFESERPVRVFYRGIDIPGQRVDLIVESEIVVELKAVERLDRVHTGQLISYLRTTGLRGGLLINFRVAMLREGIKRIVL